MNERFNKQKKKPELICKNVHLKSRNCHVPYWVDGICN